MADKQGDHKSPKITSYEKKVWDQALNKEEYVLATVADDPTEVPEILDKSTLDIEVQRRNRYVEESALVQLVENKASPIDIVDSVINEIAEELAHLKYERNKSISEGRSIGSSSIKRIESLKSLAELLIKKTENFKSSGIDFRNPKFKAVIRLWMEFLYDALQKAGLDESTIDIVFKQIEADITEWERKVMDSV